MPGRCSPASSRTRDPGSRHLGHEQAKTELKCLMPDDAKEAIGYGVRAKRLAMAARARGGWPCSGHWIHRLLGGCSGQGTDRACQSGEVASVIKAGPGGP